MADPNDGVTIAASWNALVNDKPEDNIFKNYWVLDRLKKGKAFKSIDGGDVITASLEYTTNGTVQWYSDTEAIATTRSDVFDRAEYTPKEIAGTVLQSELENAINQGGAKKFDLLDAKMKNLKKSLDATINTSLFSDGTGTSSKEFGGLKYLIPLDPTTGTVGGINPANFTFWRSQQGSGAKTTAAFDNLRASWRTIYNKCSNGVAGDHPEFIVTDRATFEGYEGLLIANERFTKQDKTGAVDGGFENEQMKFKGAMAAYDDACTAGYAYFGHTSYLQLAYMKGHWYKGSPSVSPANQTVEVFKVHAIANLISTNRRMLGVVTGIT